MSITRWNPYDEMDTMRRQMDRMVEQFFGAPARALMPTLDIARAFAPNVEVYTTDDEVVIKAELPGIEPKDVLVELTDERVHLSGELRKEEEIKEDNYMRTERQYGHFERMIPLPGRIKDAEAKASFAHGLLTIRAPLAEQPKKLQPRRLEIES